jgi:hypothetical protein
MKIGKLAKNLGKAALSEALDHPQAVGKIVGAVAPPIVGKAVEEGLQEAAKRRRRKRRGGKPSELR